MKKAINMKAINILAITSVLAVFYAAVPTNAQVFDDGVVLSKKVVESGSSYAINLEAYVTGDETHTSAPVDAALVLDTSGSMAEFVGFNYTQASTQKYTFQNLTGYTKLADWKASLDPSEKYSVSVNGSSWTGYPTKYAIYDKTYGYRHILICENSGYYQAVYATIGENTTSNVMTTGNQVSSINSLKTAEITPYIASQYGAKMKLLKEALRSFVNIISNDAQAKGLDHMVSLVRYNADSKTKGTSINDWDGKNDNPSVSAKEGAVVIKNFKSLNDASNVTLLKGGIDLLSPWSQTYPFHGVELVQELYDRQKVGGTLVKNNGHKKVVILFSDGEPGSSGFNETNANKTISDLYTLKSSYNATVFTVGIFNKVDNKCHQYMNASSQNYPKATKYSDAVKDGNADIAAHDFYNLVGTNSLEEIFEKIAEEIISGGPGIDVSASKSTVMDYVSSDFKLPAGVTPSMISVNAYHCTGYDKNIKSYIFDTTPVVPTTLEKSSGTEVSVNPSTGLVSIIGFDYAANYVRTIKKTGQDDTYDGYKLVISFPIEINANSPGGFGLYTNTGSSGIYLDDGTGSKILHPFIKPTLDLPNIIIEKSGLHKGESVVFTVQRIKDSQGNPVSEAAFTVSATCLSEGNNAVAVLKLQKPGDWTVTEPESSWAWAHETSSSPSVTKTIKEGTIQEYKYGDKTIYGTLFQFSNPDKKGTPAHAESMSNNIFISGETAGHTITTE